MNFKANVLSATAVAATLATATLAGAPAHAATIALGSTLNLGTPSSFFVIGGGGVKQNGNVLDFFSSSSGSSVFGQGTSVASSTGSFTSSSVASPLFGAQPSITDLALSATATPGIFTSAPVANFIRGVDIGTFFLLGFPLAADAVSFDLTSFIYNSSTGTADVLGVFRSGAFSTNAFGTFTSQLFQSNPSSYSISLTAGTRAVPTPALLPGLLALGVGVLRKRKAEATAEAES